ncbi:hypothetical protein G9A89_002782 [Geosiphon pyriformis]|nr:hypothetical protein G9A89_002782 [Geosiphon pyriformis]
MVAINFGKYAFPVATVDWSMIIDTIDSGNDSHFWNYCVIVVVDKLHNYKGKGRLQTTAVTPKQIQPPNWKKTQVELPINPLYHYTLRSAINISLTDVSTSNATLTFEHFLFQSKQRKAELLGPYGDYFEGFKSRLSMPSEFQSPPLQPDFGTTSSWELTELEKKQEEEKESEDQPKSNLRKPKNQNSEFSNTAQLEQLKPQH